MAESDPIPAHRPQRQLSLFDCVCIIVGIIVGSGVFGSSNKIASGVAKTFWPVAEVVESDEMQESVARSAQTNQAERRAVYALVGVWLAGGLAALMGALTFAELSTAYPEEGGIYVFLTRAFGQRMGFLYAWLEFWLIRPGNVAFVAMVMGEYAQSLLKTEGWNPPPLLLGGLGLLATTTLNLLGFQVERWGQNLLTLVKVVGIVSVVAVGLWLVPAPTSHERPPDSFPGLGLALVLVMFTYGGWSDLAYVAAEVRDPERNLQRSLILGVISVTIIYIAFTLALVNGLGYSGLSVSNAPAADLVTLWQGNWGGRAVSLLVCISCLGAMHGMIFTGSRMFYALGAGHRMFSWLGVWNDRLAIPFRSLVAQAVVTIGLLFAFGVRPEGLSRIVATTGVFYWLFFAICVVALFWLRRSDPGVNRPFRVPLYPVLPAIFALICLAMSWSGADYAMKTSSYEGLWAVGVAITGILFALLLSPTAASKSPPAK